MEYILKKWYKFQNKNEVTALYRERLRGETTRRLALSIRPIHQSEVFELYYVPTEAMLLKLETIQENDRLLQALGEALPGVARERFLYDMISEELYSSNEIEGVVSSKHEIAESTRLIAQGRTPAKPRMHSMIQSYLKLREGSLKRPEKAKDIRMIYDFITQGEIDEGNLPDGEIFVAEGADVCGSGYGKILHSGVYGEKNIIEHIERLLALLQDETLPLLVRLAVGHYYFGYIHPFYDGNGRTSRFITSLYLSEAFSIYTAYSFSNGCRIEYKRYLELFDKTNKFNSFGEMNFAIDTFLDILIAGQESVMMALEDKHALLGQASEAIEEDAWLQDNEVARGILYLFCQAYFFTDGILSKNDVVAIQQEHRAKLSVKKISDTLGALEEKGYIIKTKQKPIEYTLRRAFLTASTR